MRKSRLSLILLPLLASACAAGPAYAPPQTPAASAGPFITTADGIDRAGDLPDDWWRLYRDPALDSLIEQALAANTDLRGRSEERRGGEEGVSTGRSQGWQEHKKKKKQKNDQV